MPLTAYRELLAKRQVQVVVGSSIIAGLSVGLALPIVLLVQEETGSFASAGAVTAALAISSAVTNPWRGPEGGPPRGARALAPAWVRSGPAPWGRPAGGWSR